MPRKLKLEGCSDKKKCTPSRCDIGYIIKDYVKAVIQLLTNDVTDYNMRLLTTKCLNTAVMIAIFLLGNKRGLAVADFCDTTRVIPRHQSGKVNNESLLKLLKTDILSNEPDRYIYYILITDASLPKPVGSGFMPGHVFVIEKVPPADPIVEEHPFYYFYQSYINQYDFEGHYKHNRNSLKLSWVRVKKIINEIAYVITNQTWDKKSAKYWKDFTYVNTNDTLVGSESKNRMFLCYKKEKAEKCVENLHAYVDIKLKVLSKLKEEDHHKVYGKNELYNSDRGKPLSNKEMLDTLKELDQKIKLHRTKKL